MTLAISLLLISSSSRAFDIPSTFEEKDEVGDNFWMNPKTLETITVIEEDVSKFKKTKDPLAEVSKLMEHKGETLSLILNIKKWKVLSSKEINSPETKYLLFLGSYIDSSDRLTTFAEVYELPKNGDAKAYLFTRYDKDWSQQEIFERFKVGE